MSSSHKDSKYVHSTIIRAHCSPRRVWMYFPAVLLPHPPPPFSHSPSCVKGRDEGTAGQPASLPACQPASLPTPPLYPPLRAAGEGWFLRRVGGVSVFIAPASHQRTPRTRPTHLACKPGAASKLLTSGTPSAGLARVSESGRKKGGPPGPRSAKCAPKPRAALPTADTGTTAAAAAAPTAAAAAAAAATATTRNSSSSCGHLLRGCKGNAAYNSSSPSRSRGSNTAHARCSQEGSGRYGYGRQRRGGYELVPACPARQAEAEAPTASQADKRTEQDGD
jgi:hypothetical protein